MRGLRHVCCASFAIYLICMASNCQAQQLEAELRRISSESLAQQALETGDAVRGAIVFFQPAMACAKCHAVDDASADGIGPNLAAITEKRLSNAELVDSILDPSKTIREGYLSVRLLTDDGQVKTGRVLREDTDQIVLRELEGNTSTWSKDAIEAITPSDVSLMPAGQVNALSGKQAFLDLVRYLMDIRDGGPQRAAALQPHPSLLVFSVPEYEEHLDHAGLISRWNDDSFQRGEAIYQRVCANCHGTLEREGSLPTALKFAQGKFKNGSDPLAMYRTLTRGFGMMTAQTWMVPQQKYDVIHFIRTAYLKPHNATQYVEVDADYVSSLPTGDTIGPEPSSIELWTAMDYGPTLAHTYEIPRYPNDTADRNFAYKGIAVRLDAGAGGVSRGNHWSIFDTDTLRLASFSSRPDSTPDSQAFIDWRDIQFNGEHAIHPRVTGEIHLQNGIGPGWALPGSDRFMDDARVEGRDGKRYGPLPRDWAQYRGMYHFEDQAIFSYTVGSTRVLESPLLIAAPSNRTATYGRTFSIGPREQDLIIQVADLNGDAKLTVPQPADAHAPSVVEFQLAEHPSEANAEKWASGQYFQRPATDLLLLSKHDFSITARIKTTEGGTLLAVTQTEKNWVPNGRSLFIRNGHLCFDIGWLGCVESKQTINDGQWHDVALCWKYASGETKLFIDGKQAAKGVLASKETLENAVLRIGFTNDNFPGPLSAFSGQMEEIRFYNKVLSREELSQRTSTGLQAQWSMRNPSQPIAADLSGHAHDLALVTSASPDEEIATSIIAGCYPLDTSLSWEQSGSNLRLRVPAGSNELHFTLWTAKTHPDSTATAVAQTSNQVLSTRKQNLQAMIHGGPARWPQKMETAWTQGSEHGAFAVDILESPEPNPWLAQTRFTGLDFLPDSRLAICTWDGDVWLVTPLAGNTRLSWQRIASGLFQPLGIKVVEGQIYVLCRDQLVRLHDLNNDQEIDFYECINNDHQVTEHFHEFAMGLQTDEAGNFYYAKSGRHALPAVVPQHGTLLRVSHDGARTDILANGFRAANGVCLNPDGSFFVTDQEGFWNPKNRINWVTAGENGQTKFYGNMFGYHDVADSSDAAMEQPLCWITNEFDRSPAELLWVPEGRWGSLSGSLLNLSYGYGKVFLVPHENVNGVVQGGMIELPLPTFPTGIMRGRFHPSEGELYVCGMFAWAGNATQPGGLYRIRATGEKLVMPIQLHASKQGMELQFTEPLDPSSVKPEHVQVKVWALKRSANYGSPHINEHPLVVKDCVLSDDGKILLIELPEIEPTWCMEIRYQFRSRNGEVVEGTLHNTVHALGNDP
jgi:putative heme-binding domain-containing protein